MPELPEVETVRRGLERLIVGRQVLEVQVYNEKSFQASRGDIKAFLIGARVIAARRRAKVLIIDLSSGYSLVAHLKMTGQLVFRGDEAWAAGHPTDSFVAELPDRSTRVEFDFDDGAKLFFNDQRKFGWVKLLPTVEVENIDFLRKVGPEPLSGDPKLYKVFLSNIRRRNNTTIKAAILDQTVVAGIGNIYADESLWAAKVHPATRVRDLSDAKLKLILKSAIAVMTKSIESGGSTMKNYIRADGTKGNYLEKFASVFRREGQACPRCGTVIEKIRVAGRGTHICPKCQSEAK
ncbi:MAG: DNA-formamidopyrimidine glycosylase [Candidatus Nomurabacteria bacterium]|jgi:formamidopyrimidine-DNA glycosylase|nr:DNA-formamidopyrimidine glycosylase [Candidatus Nomurabacteria bacterium]